jgi:glyoxylase-like metal-dependent hydrolase (beta-lactamase superfamily II)
MIGNLLNGEASLFSKALMNKFISDQTNKIAESISEAAPGIFRIVVPLPIPDVESMNSYVIVDTDRNLLVDPGMAHPASIDFMEKAIRHLNVDLERTDFFITHHHLDHFGAVSRLLSGTSRIYMSKPEAEFIERVVSGEVLEELAALFETMGFTEMKPMDLFSQFYGDEYRQRCVWPFQHVADGDIIVRGGRRFTCLVSSGHSIAHCCLYESKHGILISGDQITPGVQFLVDRPNPLNDHFQSLAQLRGMDVKRVLPGHGSPFNNHRKRIDLLQAHHLGRIEAVYSVLGKDGKDAYQVTLALDGKLPDRDLLSALPPVLRFIHTRHTLGCLLHLTAQGRAEKENRNGRMIFFARG